MIIDPGKMDRLISVLKYENGVWRETGRLWAKVEYTAKIVYSAFAASSDGYKVTIRKNGLVRLESALEIEGEHCMITTFETSPRSNCIMLSVAKLAPVECILRRQGEDTGTFYGIVAEKYVRFEHNTPYAGQDVGLLLITPKTVALRTGDIVAAMDKRFSVQECHMMEKTHNAYEVYWTGDA